MQTHTHKLKKIVFVSVGEVDPDISMLLTVPNRFLQVIICSYQNCLFKTILIMDRYYSIALPMVREVIKKKNGKKAVRLTALGGRGGSPPSSLTASICENFRTFYPLNMVHWYPKQILLHCEEAEKCIFDALLTVPRQLKPWISWNVSRWLLGGWVGEQGGVSGQKIFFRGKIRFDSYIIRI